MRPKKRAEIVVETLKRLFPRPVMILRFRNNWQKLVAVILSAQTTDVQVNKITDRLFRTYKTVKDYASAPLGQFQKEIGSIGLYKTKAKHILAAAKMITKEHRGRVPKTMAELLALPGVGRKTANVLMENRDGIAVDTHVTRLSRLFRLTQEKNPEKIERDLVRLIPKKEWPLLTHRMISYGRQYCKARCTHKECPIFQKIKKGRLS